MEYTWNTHGIHMDYIGSWKLKHDKNPINNGINHPSTGHPHSLPGTSTGTACSAQRPGRSGWPSRPGFRRLRAAEPGGRRSRNAARKVVLVTFGSLKNRRDWCLILIDLWKKTCDLQNMVVGQKLEAKGKRTTASLARRDLYWENMWRDLFECGVLVWNKLQFDVADMLTTSYHDILAGMHHNHSTTLQPDILAYQRQH